MRPIDGRSRRDRDGRNRSARCHIRARRVPPDAPSLFRTGTLPARERLADFEIRVSRDGATVETVAAFSEVAGSRTRFDLGSVGARWVQVLKRGTGILSLAEVQVFAPRP